MEHQTSILPSKTVFHSWTVSQPRALIILQHGYAECAERYVNSSHVFVRSLNARHFSVYAMDLPGHGRSPGPRGITDVYEAIDDHVQMRHEVLLEAKVHNNSSPPTYLIGHSLGGLITAGSVMTSPENITGVILLSPALPGPLPSPLRWLVKIGSYLIPSVSIPIPARPINELSRNPEQNAKDATDPLLQRRQIPYLLAFTAINVADDNFTVERLKEWQVPTLVMHGTADKLTDHRQSEIFVSRINSRDKKFRSWPGGYHELLNDLDKEEVLAEILEWLEKHIAST